MLVPGAFTKTDVTFKNHPELALLLESFAGYAVLEFGGWVTVATGGNKTYLDPLTTYTVLVTVDGTHMQHVSFIGSDAQTYQTLVDEINEDLGGFAVADFSVPNTLTITSVTTGISSSVVVADEGAFPLIANLRDYRYTQSYPGATMYFRWNEIDGSQNPLPSTTPGVGLPENVTSDNVYSVMKTIDGAATDWTSGYQDIELSPIYPALTVTRGSQTCLDPAVTYQLRLTVDGGSLVTLFLKVPTGLDANGFTVQPYEIVKPTLGNYTFGQLVDDVIAPVLPVGVTCDFFPGTATHGSQVVDVGGTGSPASTSTMLVGGTTYTADITIDGVVYHVVTLGSAADTYQHLINVINATIGVHGTASLVGGNVNVTSASFGESSTVLIANVGADPLFAAPLNGFSAILAAVAGDTTYAIRFMSNTVGVTSTILVQAGLVNDLMTGLCAGFGAETVGAVAGVNGMSVLAFPQVYNGVTYHNWFEVLNTSYVGGRVGVGQVIAGPTGYGPLFTSGTIAIVTDPKKPAAKGGPISGPNPRPGLYYDGTNWRYAETDVISVTPPPGYM